MTMPLQDFIIHKGMEALSSKQDLFRKRKNLCNMRGLLTWFKRDSYSEKSMQNGYLEVCLGPKLIVTYISINWNIITLYVLRENEEIDFFHLIALNKLYFSKVPALGSDGSPQPMKFPSVVMPLLHQLLCYFTCKVCLQTMYHYHF